MREKIIPLFCSVSFRSKKTENGINIVQEQQQYIQQHTKPENISNLPSKITRNLYPQADLNEILFHKTLNENYFQLPEITHKDGTKSVAKPDFSQIEAAKSLFNGENTVCVKPTGTGKTADALYIITKNFKEGKRTFYTTPLKALSNDKFREFSKIFGEEHIGLLTGDLKLRKNAPIVIMTTEIYRNMALSDFSKSKNKNFEGVKTVVFDEAHYLSDKDRGAIWEESIMLTPKNVQILALSGTVGNAAEFTEWIRNITPIKTYLVESSPKNRHVPLIYYAFEDSDKGGNFVELVSAKVKVNKLIQNYYEKKLPQRQQSAIEEAVQIWKKYPDDKNVTNEEIEEFFNLLEKTVKENKYNSSGFKEQIRISLITFRTILTSVFSIPPMKSSEISQVLIDSKSRKIKTSHNFQIKIQNRDNYKHLVESLNKKDMLPAIIFKFSRMGCTNAAKSLSEQMCLTTDEERKEIAEIISKYSDKKIFFGDAFNQEMLKRGVGIHHAGILPSYKKLVEELFSKKLLKVVFATSTLSAGINMPARTVVLTNISRPDGMKNGNNSQVFLTSNEFHQLAGRSGRRGIDIIGNVVLFNISNINKNKTFDLILSEPDKLQSRYKPSYNFVMGYFEKYKNDENLDDYIARTFKVFQSPDKKKEIETTKESFISVKNILFKLGFLARDEFGFYPTLKGKMLAKTHGYNEIVLTEMIYDMDLERLSISELAGFAASICAVQKESFKKTDEIDDRPEFSQALFCAQNINKIARQYEQDEQIDNKNKINFESAMIVQKWVEENSKKENSIRNWHKAMKILHKIDCKAAEGDLFMIISQSVDILKQIINVSEFALHTPEFADERNYFLKLIENANYAIELMKKPPVYDNIN